MRKVADTHHLISRNGTWYYARRVPTHLVKKAKTPVLKFSLGTKDKAEAKRRASIEDVKADRWLADLETGAALTKSGKSTLGASRMVSVDTLIEHARQYVEDEDRRRARRLLAHPPADDDERDNLLDQVVGEVDEASRKYKGKPGTTVYRVADEIGNRAGIGGGDQVSETSLLSVAGRALLEVARRQGARIAGDYTHTHFDTTFAPRPNQRPRTTLATLAEQYLASVREEHQFNNVQAERTNKVAMILDYLKEAIGPTTVVADIDDDVVQKLRSTLARTPVGKTMKYPTLSLEQAIKQGEKDGRRTLSPITQSVYLQTFVKLMQLARRKQILTWNPAEDVKPLVKDTTPDNEKRLPFTLDQIKALYEGSYYRDMAKLSAQDRSIGDTAWQFWLPLLMLYSSARPNELCQLFIHDVKQTKAGVWHLDCINENETQSRKTRTSRRRIPIHAELIRFGFIDFIHRRRKAAGDKEARLFDTIIPRPVEPTNFSRRPCKWLNRNFVVRQLADLDDRQSLYSLRHAARDALRRAEAPAEALLALGGWAPAGGVPVSSAYGDVGNPDLWKTAVDAMSYPGLDLSFLYT